MHWIQSSHPPGAVVTTTQLVMRYGEATDSWEALHVPEGTTRKRMQGAMVVRQITTAIRMALAEGAHWVFLCGDDHGHKADVIMRLLDLNVPVAGSLVLGRLPPFWAFISKRLGPGKYKMKPLAELPAHRGLYTLAPDECCGDAGLLIRREVFEKLGDPWYATSSDFPDLELTARIQDAGFPIVIDLSQHMSHIAPVAIEPVLTPNGWMASFTMSGDHLPETGARRNEPFAVLRMDPVPGTESEADSIEDRIQVAGRQVAAE